MARVAGRKYKFKKKKTNMENVRQVKLDRRQAEAERGTVNLDRSLCFMVDEYGFI